MPLPGQWAVGQLYHDGKINGQQIYTQPGGIGTEVFPQQPLGEHSSLYRAGCGMWFNVYEIYQADDPYSGVQVKLLCCPMCGYIDQIISPAENYEDYQITPIVVG